MAVRLGVEVRPRKNHVAKNMFNSKSIQRSLGLERNAWELGGEYPTVPK